MSTETWEAWSDGSTVRTKQWGEYGEISPELAEEWGRALIEAAQSAKDGEESPVEAIRPQRYE